MSYSSFIDNKIHSQSDFGFEPSWLPEMLFNFQKSLVSWSLQKGRSAIFADCGLGKTFIQLVWADNIASKTDGRVLVLTPLAVAFQTVKEGEKIGVEVVHRREGVNTGDRIVVTNYERLHYFNPEDFQGVVCDESSILKNFDGETRKSVTDFMRKRPYRLLCTATAAPNDYIEMGTSSECLGDLGHIDMLQKFFKSESGSFAQGGGGGSGPKRFSKTPFTGKFRFRGHAESSFWRWVCSWARAIRKPSDMGFQDKGFELPALTIQTHTVKSKKIRDGYLFDLPAVGLSEQRSDLRRTITERCEKAAEIVNTHKKPSIVWCNLNEEGDRVTRLIPDAVQVSGNDAEEHKEKTFSDFIKGDIRVLVTKPTIAGFGLNLQHCAHMTFFPSHSYEQYYQAVRRCWRFGQKSRVVVDLITTEGQNDVLKNLQRKTDQASRMFDQLVSMMWNELKLEKRNDFTKKEEVPSWL